MWLLRYGGARGRPPHLLHHPASHLRALRQLKCGALIYRRDNPSGYIAKSVASDVVYELAPIRREGELVEGQKERLNLDLFPMYHP